MRAGMHGLVAASSTVIDSARRATTRIPGPAPHLDPTRYASGMHRVLTVQVVLIALAAAGGFYLGGLPAAEAALFGGAIALINTLLLAWRLHRGRRPLHADPGRHLRSFYASAIERFATVALLFAAGIGLLDLMPGALIAGFIVGQLALLISGLTFGID